MCGSRPTAFRQFWSVNPAGSGGCLESRPCRLRHVTRAHRAPPGWVGPRSEVRVSKARKQGATPYWPANLFRCGLLASQLRSERSPRRSDSCRLIQYTSCGLPASPLGFEPKARRFDSCLVFHLSAFKWWAVLGSNQWPLPCETGVGCLRINDRRTGFPVATGTWYHMMSFDITECHDRIVPKLSPAQLLLLRQPPAQRPCVRWFSEQLGVEPYLGLEDPRDCAVVYRVPNDRLESASCEIWHLCPQRQRRAADAKAGSVGLLRDHRLGGQTACAAASLSSSSVRFPRSKSVVREY